MGSKEMLQSCCDPSNRLKARSSLQKMQLLVLEASLRTRLLKHVRDGAGNSRLGGGFESQNTNQHRPQ